MNDYNPDFKGTSLFDVEYLWIDTWYVAYHLDRPSKSFQLFERKLCSDNWNDFKGRCSLLAYLLVLPGSRARIIRCGGRYDPQLVKRSSEWVSVAYLCSLVSPGYLTKDDIADDLSDFWR